MKVLLINNHTKYLDELTKFLPGEVLVLEKNLFNENTDVAPYDLIVFSGGSGVPTVMRYPDAYTAEISVVKTTKIPIIGICLGAEIINVAFGGTIKDLGSEMTGNYSISVKNSLAKLVLGDTISVAERHSKAIDLLPNCFDIIADSPHGIEIIRHKAKPIIGLQFHPELTTNPKLNEWIFNSISK